MITIQHKITAEVRKVLKRQGVPHSAFLRSGQVIELPDDVCDITAEIPRVNVRMISASRQVQKVARILREPLVSNYVLTISSFPSDNLAKAVAVEIMKKATEAYTLRRQQGNPKFRDLTTPIWHTVYGNLRDSLRDGTEDRPALIVIANVTDDSSSLKRDKLRDILTMYDDVPRVVVTSASDPVTFAAQCRYLTTAALFVGPNDRIREI